MDAGKQKGGTRNEELIAFASAIFYRFRSATRFPRKWNASELAINHVPVHLASLAMQFFICGRAARIRCLAFTMIRIYVARVHVAARWRVC